MDKKVAAKLATGARYLLGTIFLVFGLNGLMMQIHGSGFIPMPPPSPAMVALSGAFMALSYLMPLVKVLEVTAGVLLLSGRYVNLAIVLLAPIVVNILGVHLFVDRSGAPMALFITVLLGLLIKDRWKVFKPLLSAK